jgi:hypothetical protein
MISENLSEKPKRGRPRILSQERENECRKYGMYQADTRRSNLNEYFYMKAFAALWNYNPDGEEVAKEEFAYLIHPVTEKMKTVILTELGRLEDPDRIRRNARIICRNNPDHLQQQDEHEESGDKTPSVTREAKPRIACGA